MSQYKALRPDGNVVTTGWTITGPAPLPATHWQACAEAEPTSPLPAKTSGVYHDCRSTTPAGFLQFTLATYVLQPNERARQARVRLLGFNSAGSLHALVPWIVSTTFGGTNDKQGPSLMYVSSSNVSLVTGSWYKGNGSDQEWTQAGIDGIGVKALNYGGYAGEVGVVREIWVELDVVMAAVTVMPPSPTTPKDVSLTIPWTYQGDGDVQKAYTVRLFTQAATEVGGFDPAVTAPLAEYIKTSSEASLFVPAGVLAYGTQYAAYVKTAKDFNGSTWYGAYSAPYYFRTAPQPVVAVTAPPVTNNLPKIVWSSAGTDIGAQTEYRAKVFVQPAAGWAGFDPATNTAELIEDSGWVVSSTASYQMTKGLSNTKAYRAYVMVKTANPDVGKPAISSSGWGSPANWTTAYSAPPIPSLVVLPSNLVNVEVRVTPGVGPAPVETFYSIERRDPGGDWHNFNLAGTGGNSSMVTPTGATVVVIDYEAPLNVLVEYRAFAVYVIGSDLVANNASPTASITLSDRRVWVKDPFNPSNNRHFYVEDKWLQRSHKKARAAVRALGRVKPVVLRSPYSAEDFSTIFTILGQSDYDAIMKIIDADQQVVLQTPKGTWLVEVSGDVTIDDHLWDRVPYEELAWRITVPWQEVEA